MSLYAKTYGNEVFMYIFSVYICGQIFADFWVLSIKKKQLNTQKLAKAMNLSVGDRNYPPSAILLFLKNKWKINLPLFSLGRMFPFERENQCTISMDNFKKANLFDRF